MEQQLAQEQTAHAVAHAAEDDKSADRVPGLWLVIVQFNVENKMDVLRCANKREAVRAVTEVLEKDPGAHFEIYRTARPVELKTKTVALF